MKRVSIKITRGLQATSVFWKFTVAVDGEEFAKGTCREYIDAVHQAHGYASSLYAEASTSSETQ